MKSGKTHALNDLIQKGYNVCFLLDRLVNDYMTNAWFEEFRQDILKNFPDPYDTTGTYQEVAAPPPKEERKECRILRLISKPS